MSASEARARRLPVRVLCVDDNREVAAAFADLLRSHGDMAWLGELASAAELLARGPGLTPDIVLLDLGMPGPDPIDVLPRFLELVPDARVLVVSGRYSRELADRAVDAGAWGFVFKDDGLNEILRCIKEVASGRLAFSESVIEDQGMGLCRVVVRPLGAQEFRPG